MDADIPNLQQIHVEVHVAPKRHALKFFDGLKDEGYATFHKDPNIQLELFLPPVNVLPPNEKQYCMGLVCTTSLSRIEYLLSTKYSLLVLL